MRRRTRTVEGPVHAEAEATYETAVEKTVQYLRMKKISSNTRKKDPDAMDVHALWGNGKGKGKYGKCRQGWDNNGPQWKGGKDA